jgi:tungstate transport system permease protein
MDYIFEGLEQAFQLIFSFDGEVYEIVWLSIYISIISTILSSLIGIPFGVLIATNSFKGKKLLLSVFNTMMAFPTVVVGLFVYAFISRQGPLGSMELMFTTQAIIMGQVILGIPIMISLVASRLEDIDEGVKELSFMLGASKTRMRLTLMREGKDGILNAGFVTFGRLIGEVGIAMMLGGNIKHHTRTMTTAIALESSKGEFQLALALGIILLLCAFIIITLARFFKQRA